MKKTTTYTSNALKAILLREKYPDGNAEQLMKHTTVLYNMMAYIITLKTNLDPKHWAFTQEKAPSLPRYQVRKDCSEVRDADTDKTVGFFHNRLGADDYAQFLNDRLKP